MQTFPLLAGLCLATCDPVLQNCMQGQCAAVNDGFSCILSTGAAPVGSACESLGSCDPGLACIPAENTPGCEESADCCSSFCNVSAADPDAPCLSGQTCLAWFEEGQAPEGSEHIGICGVAG